MTFWLLNYTSREKVKTCGLLILSHGFFNGFYGFHIFLVKITWLSCFWVHSCHLQKEHLMSNSGCQFPLTAYRCAHPSISKGLILRWVNLHRVCACFSFGKKNPYMVYPSSISSWLFNTIRKNIECKYFGTPLPFGILPCSTFKSCWHNILHKAHLNAIYTGFCAAWLFSNPLSQTFYLLFSKHDACRVTNKMLLITL